MTATTIVSRSPDETRRLGTFLGRLLGPGDFVALEGDLGAGKTLMVQAIAAELGYDKGVRSPTFMLLHHYATPIATV
ncbi:MAG TPA: tRNA (adenosine(37)-N6)-threonylcarbamoyltransferase complex ATPase subunit type 1 TsaE, partial [Candidatus Xenobia bacterium]